MHNNPIMPDEISGRSSVRIMTALVVFFVLSLVLVYLFLFS